MSENALPLNVTDFNRLQKQIIVFDTNNNGRVDETDIAVAGPNLDSFHSGDSVPFDNETYRLLRELFGMDTTNAQLFDPEAAAASLGLELRQRPPRDRCICTPSEQDVLHDGTLIGTIVKTGTGAMSRRSFLTQILPYYEMTLRNTGCIFSGIAISDEASELLERQSWFIRGAEIYHTDGMSLGNLAEPNLFNKSVSISVMEGLPSNTVRVTATECDESTIDYNFNLITKEILPAR